MLTYELYAPLRFSIITIFADCLILNRNDYVCAHVLKTCAIQSHISGAHDCCWKLWFINFINGTLLEKVRSETYLFGVVSYITTSLFCEKREDFL